MKILLPASVPFILAGIRLAMGRGLTGVAIAEWFGATEGLGYLIFFAGQTFNIPILFVGVAVFAALGITGFEIDPDDRNVCDALEKGTPRKLSMGGPVLVLRNLSKAIHSSRIATRFVIFSDINLSVADGEFVSIVGPSGCGKTTLLRVINGLCLHSGGEILIDGRLGAGSG